MIILTKKQLEALKEEVKADLKREVVQETSDMIIHVFRSVFVDTEKAISEYAQQLVKEKRDDDWWNRVWFGEAPKKKKTFYATITETALSIGSILDGKVKSQFKDQIAEIVTEYVRGEDFVDEVISRINRKQLIGGKQ